ncbi:MAG: indolepyruvate oxidoreductase subunit beta [Anaerolineae bacterium]|nr:indolepyruvate oxidoreductase subunit beta [Anaerolineae bacterium]
MDNHLNFLFVGVGGQGVLTASDIAAQVGLDLGLEAKKSEIHGFAQRGGVVESHIRWGTAINSPTCEKGTVDILVAFELLEAVRCLDWLVPGGTIIVNMQKIVPMSVNTGDSVYPTQTAILDRLRQHTGIVIAVDALPLAEKAGNIRTVNTILLAALATALRHDPDLWEKAILKRVPEQYAKVNSTAFRLGQEAAQITLSSIQQLT